MKRRAVILLVLVSLLVSAVGATAQASPKEGFYLEKSCSDVECVITVAEGPFADLVGEIVEYQDRVLGENPGGHFFEIARITVDDGEGTTLRGQIRWKDDHGLFTISKGTGDMQGLHASGTINYLYDEDGRSVFSLDGTYHFAGK